MISTVTSGLVAFAAMSSPQAGKAVPVFENGMAQVVPAFSNPKDWIFENLWVEVDVDSDQNGKKDRVHVNVTRPKQTDTEGLKVAVVYESSPYFSGTSDGVSDMWDVRQELGAESPPRKMGSNIKFDPNKIKISNSLINQWVPRGFAVVHSEATGTGLSEGAPTIGGDAERFAPKAVIDWLNGRAKGYTTIDGTTEVRVSWCTGKVGMTGTSYDGTIPVAAATTAVEGLMAIIPVAPNTSYYHYYRSNGLIRHPGGWLGEDIDSLYDFIHSGNPARREWNNRLIRDRFLREKDRKTGDYNAFWAERDLLKHAKNIKCAVMMGHAFNDWNVVPEHSVRISQAVKGRVPLVQYFHQGGHGGDPPFDMMNKWFSRFLYGVQNGIETGPKSYIVREAKPGEKRGPTPAPTAYPDYPHPDAKTVKLFPVSGGSLAFSSKKGAMESFTDNVEFGPVALAKAATSPNRLLYTTAELKEPLHISGTPKITIRMSATAPAVNLSVYLVQLPWTDGPVGTANLITRGWADPQNWKSLRRGGNYDSMALGSPLKPGEFVKLTFDLQPDDQIIPAGKKIGLMILSSDRDFTLWPKPGAMLTVDLGATELSLPVVGGKNQFSKSTGSPTR